MPSHKYNIRRSTKPVAYYDGDSSSDYEPDEEDEETVASTALKVMTMKSVTPSFDVAKETKQGPPTHSNFYTLQTQSSSDLLSAQYHQDDTELRKCPNNCGWGHYDGECGVKIPLARKGEQDILHSTQHTLHATANLLSDRYSSSPSDNAQRGDDSGYASTEEAEEKSVVFAWDRFKDAGKKGGERAGRDYRVDGEGDCVMGGV